MASQLIAPPELAAPSVKHLPCSKRIQLWGELVDACEAFLLAGLRDRLGPHGDLQEAYRQWYARKMDEHDKAQIEFLENLSRREAARGNGIGPPGT
jgi:hypothetical protein